MLKPGDAAPDFELECIRDDRVTKVSLGHFTAELLVLFFYPRDFSFICPTEVAGFQKSIGDFTSQNSEIAGVSVDPPETHRQWARELGGINYPLLADPNGALARKYGIFDETDGVALRATFIIDRQRRIAYAVASRNNVGRSVSETLRVVQALRSGRLCPADWRPGQDFGPTDREY